MKTSPVPFLFIHRTPWRKNSRGSVRSGSFGLHIDRFFLPVTAIVVDQHDDAAHDPAGRITKGHDFNRIEKFGYDEQINLAENDEAAHHNDGGCQSIACAPQRTCVNLIDAAAGIKRHHKPQKQSTKLAAHPASRPNSPTSCGARIRMGIIIRTLMDTDMARATRLPRLARFRFPEPRFCPTKVVTERATLCTGKHTELIDLSVGRPSGHACGSESY